MAFAPDGRLFVAEKAGRLRVVPQDGTLSATPFIELSVTRDGERGLLGIAFDPGFATNGRLYLYYTTSQGHNRVSRFTANPAAPDRAAAGSEVVILDNIPGASTHDAGSMHFGPDGYLYVAVGDARTPTLAQSLDSLSGKILRLNPTAYPNVVPTNNPFATNPSARREIWAYGLRNPFTFAFDRSGRMFINDVGQGMWEEINRGEAGANYGWPTCEGPLNTGNGSCSSGSFTYPLVAYGRSEGGAVTGAVVYERTQFPAEYRGNYFFGDYVGGWIRRITTANQVVTFLTDVPTPIDLDVGPDGSLYFLSYTDGEVYRVQYEGGNRAPNATFTMDPASGPPPLTVTFDASESTDPDNDRLTYAWNFGDGGSATGAFATHTYAVQGTRTATLTVTDGRGGSATASRTVAIGSAPTATITAPAVGMLYAAGNTIAFEGTANDPETGVLPASAFSWTIAFHHDTHSHPFLGPLNGVTRGSFVVPDTGETSANVWYRIQLTVTDTTGLTYTTVRDVYPRRSQLTLTTEPSGIVVTLDGQPVTTPHTFTGVVGLRRRIEAPAMAIVGGLSYTFSSWSDGGGRTHDIVTPAATSVYTARFTAASTDITPRHTFLTFDGVDDHVAVTDAGTLGQGSALTITAWVRPGANDLRMFLAAKGTSSDPVWSLSRAPSNNKIVFSLNTEAGTRASADSPAGYATDLGWHHVAAVYDGSQVLIYVDGSREGTTSAPLTGAARAGSNAICLGGREASDGCGTYAPMLGDLDDVTIWNRALSAAEIQTVMSGALPSNLSGLGAAWQLNEGVGQTVTDSSPYRRSGQLGNAPGTDAADPQWVVTQTRPRPDATAPVVSLTAPANGTQVSGIVGVSATATDDSSIAGVQFFLDGVPLQPEDVSAPFSLAWNTTATANGPHTIAARARDAAGNTTVSAAITVSVSNAVSLPVISDVRVSVTTATAADILWASNVPTTGQVEYGTTTAYGRSTAPSAAATLHVDTLSGLTPGTKYYFRVRATSSAGTTAVTQPSTFVTPLLQPASLPRARFLRLDGAGDRVSIPSSGNIGEGTALTVSAWIRPSANDITMWIATKGRASQKQWTLERGKYNNKVVFRVWNASETMAVATSSTAVATDLRWHHIAGVYDGQDVHIYVDGNLSNREPAPLSGPIINADHSLCIGAMDRGSAGDCADGDTFRGDIDDVRIYNRALTQAQIRETMNVELQGNEPGLSGYWRFNDGQGQIANDSSPSALDGILGNTTAVESIDPAWMEDPEADLQLPEPES